MIHITLLRQLLHLITTRIENVSRARTGAEYDFETGARGDDESRCLIIERYPRSVQSKLRNKG
jgi:hypothetical protein